MQILRQLNLKKYFFKKEEPNETQPDPTQIDLNEIDLICDTSAPLVFLQLNPICLSHSV